jgi:hypothetical protein
MRQLSKVQAEPTQNIMHDSGLSGRAINST